MPVQAVGRALSVIGEETEEAPCGSEGDVVAFDIDLFHGPMPFRRRRIVRAADVPDGSALARCDGKCYECAVRMNEISLIRFHVDQESVPRTGSPGGWIGFPLCKGQTWRAQGKDKADEDE